MPTKCQARVAGKKKRGLPRDPMPADSPGTDLTVGGWVDGSSGPKYGETFDTLTS